MAMELVDRKEGTFQTTSSLGNEVALAYTLPDACVALVRAFVVARRPDNGDSAAYVIERPVKRHGGAGAAIASTNQTKVAYDTIDATWDASIGVSGNDVRVTVTGVDAGNIEWLVVMEIYLYQP